MKILKTLFFVIVSLSFFWIHCYGHEYVHQYAFKGDNINSSMNFYAGIPVEVQYDEWCKSSECELINGFNEVIEYNLTALFVSIIIGFSMIIYILDNKKYCKEDLE